MSPGPGLADRIALGSHVDEQQRALIIGVSGQETAGGTVTVRSLASRATEFVQLHIQSDAGGEGGATYDPTNFTSSARVDCRQNRQQDHSIARGGGVHYYVWIIPVFEHEPGSFTKYDGDDAEDRMAFLDLGV